MDFFLDNLINNLDTVSFQVYFDRKLSKVEQKILIFLISEFEKNINSKDISIKNDILIDTFKFKNLDDLISTLNKFTKKELYYYFKYTENNILIAKGFFYIIPSIYYTNESIKLTLADEIIESTKSSSIFNKIHLRTLIKFKLPYSTKLYQELTKYIDIYNSFEISLDKIKGLFHMEDSYDRFYDFEKNILSPAINEINRYSEYHINYEKIKSGDGKTNRIISLKFSFYNKNSERIQKRANELMALIKDKVSNFDLVLNKIHSYLESENYKYVYNNLIFSIEHLEGDFDSFFIEALKNNFVKTRFKEKTSKADSEYELLVDISMHFSNIFKLESELYKQLSKLKFYYDFEFVTLLHQLKLKNKLEFSNEEIKIFVEFNKVGDSYIKIYKVK